MAELARRLGEVLREAHRRYGEISARYQADVRPGSPAAGELAHESDFAYSNENTPVQTCFSLATLRMAAASDQLGSSGLLITAGAHAYGPLATARVALECAARAWWALEPDIGPKARAVRGIVELFDSLREGSRLPGELGEGQRTILERRVRDLEAAGYVVGRNDRGRLAGTINGVAVPPATHLIREQLRNVGNLGDLGELGELAYRVLSAQAHGVSYGLAQGIREAAPGEGPPPDPDRRIAWVQATPKAESFLHWTIIGVQGFSQTVLREMRLFGWDKTDWQAFDREALLLLRKLLLSKQAPDRST